MNIKHGHVRRAEFRRAILYVCYKSEGSAEQFAKIVVFAVAIGIREVAKRRPSAARPSVVDKLEKIMTALWSPAMIKGIALKKKVDLGVCV